MDNNTENARRMDMSPTRHQASPMKQKTPSRRASHMSPRKSPATVRKTFQYEAVSFTPKRTHQPPRAWERRPATPFVPRDDKQKIWKRVPLGELGIDSNRPAGLSRRAQEGTKDCLRIVKKLKVGHEDDLDSNGEDKENLILAVGSKIVRDDDDDYYDHLKKKKVSFTNNTSTIDATAGVDSGLATDSNALLATPETTMDDYGSDDEQSDSCDKELEFEEHITADSNGTKAEILSLSTTTQSSLEADVEAVRGPLRGNESEAEGEGEANLPRKGDSSIDMDSTVTGRCSDQEDLPSQQARLVGHSDEDIETSDDGTTHEQRSSSPPTILAENITIDELAAKQSAEVSLDEQATATTEQNSSIGQDGSRRTSDGEAAFLRAFMDRTMNEKTAREKALESSSNIDKVETQQQPSEDLEEQCESVEQEVEDRSEPSSPLRRSKRAVVTSIPRPQSVPNAIQLKRANGNEFIFTANKATSAMNIVATTRANTKKNKGSSLNVPTRLEQLTAQKVDEAGGVEDQIKTEPSNKTSKKRKQDKMSENLKTKKVLRWNDENLVAFREADPEMHDDLDDIEDSSQEKAQTTRSDEDINKAVKLKLTVSPSITQKADKDNTRPSSLRRIRRGIAGSVNGTPAPKTRARKLEEESAVEDKDEDETADITDSEANKSVPAGSTSKIPSSNRRSRMPVPTSTRKSEAATAGAKGTVAGVKVQGKAEQQLGRRSLRIRQ